MNLVHPVMSSKTSTVGSNTAEEAQRSLKSEKKVHNQNLEDQLEESKNFKLLDWAFLNEDLKPDINGNPSMMMQLHMIRDFVLCFFVLTFLSYPMLQLIPMILFYSGTFFVAAKYKPFEKKSVQFLTLVNEGGYILVLMLYVTIHLLGDNIEPKDKHQMFGYPLIGLTIALLLTNIGVGLYESYCEIKEFCSKDKADD
jgi:hypothetical protein